MKISALFIALFTFVFSVSAAAAEIKGPRTKRAEAPPTTVVAVAEAKGTTFSFGMKSAEGWTEIKVCPKDLAAYKPDVSLRHDAGAVIGFKSVSRFSDLIDAASAYRMKFKKAGAVMLNSTGRAATFTFEEGGRHGKVSIITPYKDGGESVIVIGSVDASVDADAIGLIIDLIGKTLHTATVPVAK